MTDQLEKLVAETPQGNVRSPKPQIEDFTEYGEGGKKVVNVAGYQDSLTDWLEQEKEIINRNKVPFYCTAWSNVRSVRNAIKSGFVPAWVEMTAKPVTIVDEMNR